MVKKNVATIPALLSLLFLAAVWLPAASVAAADDIADKIANAKTAADYEAIAAYYDKEAAAATEKADLHKRMLANIKKAGGPGVAKWNMDKHCEELIKQYESSASMYGQMAKAQREIAKELK